MRRLVPRRWIVVGLLMVGATVFTARAGDVPTSAMDVHPLLMRAEVPDVSLRSADGSAFDLAAAVKKQPSIVIFYRGGW